MDKTDFDKEFEANMTSLVADGLMIETTPGHYSLTPLGEEKANSMRIDKALSQSLGGLSVSIDNANKQRRGLIAACRATLLFHSGSPWSAAKSEEWKQLTGRDEATTRQLCNFIREQLEFVE